MKKKIFAALTTALATAPLIPVLASHSIPVAHAADGCAAVDIVVAEGTGGVSTARGTDPLDFGPGNLAIELQKRHPGDVTVWDIPYPSSSGGLYSAIHAHGETTTYGDSRLQGDMKGIEHIKEVKKRCGNATKFFITGYSQGASVAGDIASIIAHGGAEGVDADDVMGVLLYADPGRSGASQYSGPSGNKKAYIPIPRQAHFQRNGEFATGDTDPHVVGWTGQRSLDFTGLEGKVISLCSETDLACSSQEGSLLRAMADISDKNTRPTPESYRNNTTIKDMVDGLRVVRLVPGVLTSGAIGQLLGGNVGEAVSSLKQVVSSSSMGANDKDTLMNALNEVDYLWELLRSDEVGYGRNVPPKEIVAHMIQSLPSGFLQDAHLPVPPEILGPLEAGVKVLAGASVSSIPEEVRERMAYQVHMMATMGSAHMEYFLDARPYNVDGVKAHTWAIDAVSEGITNVINDTPFTVPSGDSPKPSGAAREVSDPCRLPDGLKWVAFGDESDIAETKEDGTPVNIPPSKSVCTDSSPAPSVGSPGSSKPSGVSRASQTPPPRRVRSVSKDDDSSEVFPSVEATSVTAEPAAPVAAVSAPAGAVVNTGGVVDDRAVWEKVGFVFQ